MARPPSLRSQLNQIRAWVRQGRTNAWIAHQLDISIDQVERFKREHQLDETEPAATAKAIDPLSIPVPEASERWDEEDENAEEAEDEQVASEPSSGRGGQRRSSRGGRGGRGGRGSRGGGSRSGGSRAGGSRSERERPSRQSRSERDERGRPDREGGQSDREGGKRSRGRRGGRRRGKIPTYEATFDHGRDGYGLWLDPAVIENPVYLKHWSGHRAIEVRLDPDSITIRRADVPGESEKD